MDKPEIKQKILAERSSKGMQPPKARKDKQDTSQNTSKKEKK